MRIFFEKMMLHHPGVVVAAAVGGFQLCQRVLVQLELAAGLPWARQLQLIKDTEFHDVSPAAGLVVSASVFAGGPKSSLRQFPHGGTPLALTSRMVSFTV